MPLNSTDSSVHLSIHKNKPNAISIGLPKRSQPTRLRSHRSRLFNNIRLFAVGNSHSRKNNSECNRQRDTRRYGRGLVEVIVVVGIFGFVAILVLMALPRGRESSRLITCQKNLMQAGLGLEMYHLTHQQYPVVPRLGDSVVTDGPIKAMLDAFLLPDLQEIRDPTKPPSPGMAASPKLRVRGISCPSDSNAMAGPFTTTISYRANTGDNPDGQGGPFQPGQPMTSSRLEAADGLSFTAAFAERLVGDGQSEHSAVHNYASIPGPVTESDGGRATIKSWRGDAGSVWSESSWRSSLYNHALAPNGSPSCIADDNRSALMGVSSGHVNRVNVLLMDGSLRAVTPTINLQVWRALGSVGKPARN